MTGEINLGHAEWSLDILLNIIYIIELKYA